MAANKSWKVGELARLSGVSVRALHHYDEIGLLRASGRSESGYRLYCERDIARLQAIKSLQQMGFSLQDVRAALERPDFSPQHIIEAHLARLREHIALQQQLCARLEAAQARLGRRQAVSVEEFLEITEAISMTEKYFTPEQATYLEERRALVGEDRIHEVEAEWPRLMDEVRAAIERGDDPASEPSQVLARRWNALVEEFTGGDASVRESLRSMYENESNVAGMDIASMKPLYDFIGRAQAAARS